MPLNLIGIHMARKSEYRQVREFLFQAPGQSETIHLRHLDVGDDQIRSGLANLDQRFLAIAHFSDLISSERSLDQVPHRRLVIDNQYPQFLVRNARVYEGLDFLRTPYLTWR